MHDLLLIGGATDIMLTRMAEKFTIHKLSDIDDFAAWASEHGAKIEAIATNGGDGVKPEILAALPNVKVISAYGVGYDAIDTTVCVERGIKVSHTPNVLNAEVANTTLLLLLAGLRNFRHDEAWARSGDWEKHGNAPLSRSPDNLTIGILGLGRIGQEIADRLSIFNPTIVYHTRSKKDVAYKYYDDLTAMAHDCDVLVCITPGGVSTNNIVNKEVLEALGPTGMLINVSRGSVVDEEALIAALEAGKLGLAGLDVFAGEPHIPDALKAVENTVLLPHVGSGTVETRAAMGGLTVDNLLQFLDDGTVLTSVPECAHL
jgi:lactate dehydrogenase-like 2-hydroxyacid dehydrogenase